MQDSKKGFLPFRHRVFFSQDQCLKILKEKECMKVILVGIEPLKTRHVVTIHVILTLI